jgi:hypothetical protein
VQVKRRLRGSRNRKPGNHWRQGKRRNERNNHHGITDNHLLDSVGADTPWSIRVTGLDVVSTSERCGHAGVVRDNRPENSTPNMVGSMNGSHKDCLICRTTKPIVDFSLSRGRPMSYCKPCASKKSSVYRSKHKERYFQHMRRSNLRQYGITPDAYDTLLQSQNGVCAICGRGETRKGRRRLAVDHCHATGKVRGLLCASCNDILSRAADNPQRLSDAIHYLKRHQ